MGKSDHRQLIATIGHLADDPELYDSFLQQWRALIAHDAEAGLRDMTAIERAAEGAIDAISAADALRSSPSSPGVQVQRLEEPALILDEQGRIEELNDFAWHRYGLDVDQNVEAIKLDFYERGALAHAIARVVNANDPATPLVMARGFDPAANVNVTALFFRAPASADSGKRVLMIVNTGQSSEQSAQLLGDGCGLTHNEQDVLRLFLEGRTLSDVAKLRERSSQTIRNQLQSIFEKTGCNSQSDLMRLAFSLACVVSNVAPVLETATRTNRRTVTFLRPDGRVIDATVAGARQGRLVISLPSIFGHPLTQEIEERLERAGIRMICIARPGMGGTDPAPEAMSEGTCVAEDVVAVLDQLQIEQCVLLGRASCTPLVFQLCGAIPSRLAKAIVVNGVVPAPFIDRSNVAGEWTQSLMAAAITSTGLAALILRSGRRLMRVIGARNFLSRMYQRSASDVEILMDDSVVASIEEGAQMVAAQGFDAASQDMIQALNDWSSDLAASPIRVTLLQGAFDPNVPIEASRNFARSFPETCRLIEVPDGGGLLNYSHLHLLLQELEA